MFGPAPFSDVIVCPVFHCVHFTCFQECNQALNALLASALTQAQLITKKVLSVKALYSS